MNLLVSGNTIVTNGASGTSESIDIDAEGASGATVNATVLNNSMNNIANGATPPGGNNIDVNTETAASIVRLETAGNISGAGPNDPDIVLTNVAGGTFLVKGAGGRSATSANIQSLNPSGGTAAVNGTITFNNNAAITRPATPATPTVPPVPPAALLAASGGVGDSQLAPADQHGRRG